MDVIRLIASDLDATLLDDQSQLPPDFAETVRALAERGIRFAATSGRPIYTLEEMFAPLQDDIILVGDNGGAICWKGESLYLSEMDVADWHTLAGQARSAGHAAVLCGLETAYVEEQFRPYDRVFKRFYTKVEYVPHLEDVTAQVDKFTIYFPEGDAQKGYDALYGPVWGGRFSVAVAGADWVDIMNPGVHKGAALLRLGERLGVLPEGMMAFGDTFNDAEMLKAAKYGFLVENGSSALREEVPFLAPPNTSSGVMQVLRRVLAQNGRVCQSEFRRAKQTTASEKSSDAVLYYGYKSAPSTAESRISPMGEGALPFAFCQMSRTPARIARMPMPRHAGEGVSAAVEMPSRVLSPMVKAVERMRATTQGRTPERKASTPAYLSRSWMRAAMSRMMKKDGRTTPSVAQNAPSTPPCDAPMKVAMLTASGPGVDSDTAMKLRNSASESQPLSRTFSRMREIMP